MDLIPVLFITFKVLVLVTGMFFAVRWHYEQGQKRNQMEKRALLHAAGKVAAVFVLSLLGVGLVTFALARMVGLDLGFQ